MKQGLYFKIDLKSINMGIGSILIFLFFSFLLFGVGNNAWGYKKDPSQVLKEIFPNAQIEVKNIVLTKEQVEMIEKLSNTKLGTRFVSWYIAKKGNNVAGYAYIDSHIVRTHPEVVLYIITPEGKIDLVQVLAFNEPLEYMPDENWLKLFKGKELKEGNLRLRKDIPNMTGATLTARAITDNTRKVLAIWQILFGSEQR